MDARLNAPGANLQVMLNTAEAGSSAYVEIRTCPRPRWWC